ncbi:MAG: hypothetical protein U0359_35960 [Byssovorax sp.]
MNRFGLRQGFQTTITNLDATSGGAAAIDTAAHEGFHALVARHIPTIWKMGDAQVGVIPIGAPVKYLEEVAAYGVGHVAALRPHGVIVAPIEAFRSLKTAEQATTLGTMAIGGAAGYAIYNW